MAKKRALEPLEKICIHFTFEKMSNPGFEPGLSRPQRDVLTARRIGRHLLSHDILQEGHIFLFCFFKIRIPSLIQPFLVEKGLTSPNFRGGFIAPRPVVLARA